MMTRLLRYDALLVDDFEGENSGAMISTGEVAEWRCGQRRQVSEKRKCWQKHGLRTSQFDSMSANVGHKIKSQLYLSLIDEIRFKE